MSWIKYSTDDVKADSFQNILKMDHVTNISGIVDETDCYEEKLAQIQCEELRRRVNFIHKAFRTSIETPDKLKRFCSLNLNIPVTFSSVLKNGKWTSTCTIYMFSFSTIDSGKNLGLRKLVKLICNYFITYPHLLNEIIYHRYQKCM